MTVTINMVRQDVETKLRHVRQKREAYEKMLVLHQEALRELEVREAYLVKRLEELGGTMKLEDVDKPIYEALKLDHTGWKE